MHKRADGSPERPEDWHLLGEEYAESTRYVQHMFDAVSELRVHMIDPKAAETSEASNDTRLALRASDEGDEGDDDDDDDDDDETLFHIYAKKLACDLLGTPHGLSEEVVTQAKESARYQRYARCLTVDSCRRLLHALLDPKKYDPAHRPALERTLQTVRRASAQLSDELACSPKITR